ncbi:hypothetical protein D3C71_1795450 [compost metagenome]
MREGAGGFFRGLAQAQTAQVRQRQRALTTNVGFTARADLGDVTQSVGTLVAKTLGIFARANTE